ncbi:MAG: glyoxalase, partial [Thermoleophilia bacterium]|nr:glyoxalase [Thermoleophilia bacterium]
CGRDGLHIGAEPDFTPATRAHLGIRVSDSAAYDELCGRLSAAGYEVCQAAEPIAERRMKTHDCFGNMVEFLVGTTG